MEFVIFLLAVVPELWLEQTAKLNVPYALTNTVILVLSSVTCQFGVFPTPAGAAGVP